MDGKGRGGGGRKGKGGKGFVVQGDEICCPADDVVFGGCGCVLDVVKGSITVSGRADGRTDGRQNGDGCVLV